MYIRKTIVSGFFVANAFVSFMNAQEKLTQYSYVNSRVDSLIQDAESKKIFSGLVAISSNQKQFYYKHGGYADWQSKRPLNRSTLFNIGSLNKQFTEEIIHQLVKENKLKYEDKLSSYLNIYPSQIGDKITVQLLLDMKAGLGDYLISPKFTEIENRDFKLVELIDIIKEMPLLYEPGKDEQYSNSGYVVLGALIEKITGKSYEENLHDRIVIPVGLKNIYYTKTQKEYQTNRAFGTFIDCEGEKKSVDDCTNSTPAGGIYSNIDDLLLFAEAKMNSSLPSGKKYGRGAFAGGTNIWNSMIVYDNEKGIALVVMANCGKIADEVAPRIRSIIRKEKYPPLNLPFEMTFYNLLKNKGEKYVKQNIRDICKQARLDYDERFLNYFGYQFLNSEKVEMALKLFKINTELFPKNANTFDSLGECCMKLGDKHNALKFYKKALSLDSENNRIKKSISDLEGVKP